MHRELNALLVTLVVRLIEAWGVPLGYIHLLVRRLEGLEEQWFIWVSRKEEGLLELAPEPLVKTAKVCRAEPVLRVLSSSLGVLRRHYRLRLRWPAQGFGHDLRQSRKVTAIGIEHRHHQG